MFDGKGHCLDWIFQQSLTGERAFIDGLPQVDRPARGLTAAGRHSGFMRHAPAQSRTRRNVAITLQTGSHGLRRQKGRPAKGHRGAAIALDHDVADIVGLDGVRGWRQAR